MKRSGLRKRRANKRGAQLIVPLLSLPFELLPSFELRPLSLPRPLRPLLYYCYVMRHLCLIADKK